MKQLFYDSSIRNQRPNLQANPSSIYEEGLFKLDMTYDNTVALEGDFSAHCSGNNQSMPVSSINGSASVPEGKTPLVLVHGWTIMGQVINAFNLFSDGIVEANIEKAKYAPAFCYWQPFITNFLAPKNASSGLDILRQNYELYSFSYDSQKSIAENAEKLKVALNYFPSSQKVVVVAHSMGGLVTNTYIQKNSDNKIKHLISAGTPYMGSTLMLCKKVKFGSDNCNDGQLDMRVIANAIDLVRILNPQQKILFAAIMEKYLRKVSRYQGSLDLSWQFAQSIFSGNALSFTEPNPFLEDINQGADFDRHTVFYGNAVDGELTPPGEKLLAKAMFLVSDYFSDSVVPEDSACLTASANDTRIGCSDSNLNNLIFRDGLSHTQIYSTENMSPLTVELLRLANKLTDIDDGTPDGNQRVFIGSKDSTGLDCEDKNARRFDGSGVC